MNVKSYFFSLLVPFKPTFKMPIYSLPFVGFFVISYFILRNVIKKDITASGKIQMLGLVAFALAELVHLVR